MTYLVVTKIHFEQVEQSSDRLLIGRFTKQEIEDVLENAQSNVFSVYFYQNESEASERKVRLGFSERTEDGDGLLCPDFCYP